MWSLATMTLPPAGRPDFPQPALGTAPLEPPPPSAPPTAEPSCPPPPSTTAPPDPPLPLTPAAPSPALLPPEPLLSPPLPPVAIAPPVPVGWASTPPLPPEPVPGWSDEEVLQPATTIASNANAYRLRMAGPP